MSIQMGIVGPLTADIDISRLIFSLGNMCADCVSFEMRGDAVHRIRAVNCST